MENKGKAWPKSILVSETKELATFAAGCFWCVEAIFNAIKGVEKVVSGYTGGNIQNPTYEQVSNGSTGHAEAIQITYNPRIISYNDLLFIFWRTHDPTTLNSQGADIGTQYRSAIFYHNQRQKKSAILSKEAIEKEKLYDKKVVTEIVPFTNFYSSEEFHQKYYVNNPNQPYCKIVIDPKMAKLRKELTKFLKSTDH